MWEMNEKQMSEIKKRREKYIDNSNDNKSH